MRAFLALAATAWLGAGGGAVFDNVLPAFWVLWAVAGVLIAATLAHQRTRRSA